jgi:xylulokinase
VIVAHDLGTTGDKASLHDDDGRLVAAVTVHYDTRYAAGGVAEQDPRAWWRACCEATRRLLVETGTPTEKVRALGLSGQMMGAVFLDHRHQPLRPAMIWADHRSTPQAARIGQRVSVEEAYRITGHRLNPTYSLTKIAWVRENEPDAFARTKFVCQAKDYVVARLTGRGATDPSDASSTNAYDQEAAGWRSACSRRRTSTRSYCPRSCPRRRSSARCSRGLPTSSAYALARRSSSAGATGPLAAIGAGVVTPEDGAYLYLGSSSWVSFSAAAPLYDPQMRTMTFNHVVPGLFVPTATMVAGAGSLQWVSDVLAPHSAGAEIETLLAEAAHAVGLDDHLYFLPHLLGERSPHWNPAARGAFVGLSPAHARGDLVRALLEGVVLNLLTCVEAFRGCGAEVAEVAAIGGGAKSDLWLQLFADAFGVPVTRRNIVDEANSLGAAVTAGVGAGVLDDFTVARTLSAETARFLPDPSRADLIRLAHETWISTYRALESSFPAGAE